MTKRAIIGNYQAKKLFDMSEPGVSVATALSTEKLFSGENKMPIPVLFGETTYYSSLKFEGQHDSGDYAHMINFGVTFSRPPDALLLSITEYKDPATETWGFANSSTGTYFRSNLDRGSFTNLRYWKVEDSRIRCIDLIDKNGFAPFSRLRNKTKYLIFDPEDGP